MNSLDLIGSYEERRFPEFRYPTIDTMNWGSKRHHIPILLEIDVTDARVAIRAQKKSGQRVGLTAWIVKCVAQAVSEHKSIQALRQGNWRLVIFDDVDVALIVERAIANETLPMPYLIRKANEKTVATIHAEIRAIHYGRRFDSLAWLMQFYAWLPKIVRDLFWRSLFRNPFLIKQKMGTIGMSVIGMSGQTGMSWGFQLEFIL